MFKLKAYSPGVVTLLIYVPLFVIGTLQLVGNGLPLTEAIMAIALGIGYHIFSVIRQAK